MIQAEICGINDPAAVVAAAPAAPPISASSSTHPRRGPYPDAVAAELAGLVPPRVGRVGLFVDPDDATLETVLKQVPLTMLQLHGGETPERVQAIKRRFGLPVMKAIGVGAVRDLDSAPAYFEVADWLLFDAKPPKQPGALPGGNASPFDWALLAGRTWPLPWMLSGGLAVTNLAEAVRLTGAAWSMSPPGLRTGKG